MPVSAWKNGGGRTRAIRTQPDGASLETFAWRLSLADIDADGPFSAFPGVDRVFTVASRGQLVLDVDGVEQVVANGDVIAFPGEARVHARLTHGPTTDLNLMTRRGSRTGAIEVRDLDGPVEWSDPSIVAVVVLDGVLRVGEGRELGRFDALLPRSGQTRATGTAASVAIVRVAANPR